MRGLSRALQLVAPAGCRAALPAVRASRSSSGGREWAGVPGRHPGRTARLEGGRGRKSRRGLRWGSPRALCDPGKTPRVARVRQSCRESRLPTRCLLTLFALLLTAALCAWSAAEAGEPHAFRDRVAPILKQHCLRCHQGAKAKGRLDLSSAKGLAAGADGSPIVVPGKPQESRLIEVVSGDKPEMPKNGKPLLAAEVQALRYWIAAGAEWPATLSSKMTRSIGGRCGRFPNRRFPVR